MIGFSSAANSCFTNYTNLINLTFDDSLEYIDNGVFFMTHVTYFTIPKSVKLLSGSQCFDEGDPFVRIFVHPENKNYCDIDGVVYSKDKRNLYHWPGAHGEEYVIIPNFVVSTSVAAFGSSNKIKFVQYPQSIQSIGSYQFHRNTAIEFVEIMNKPNPVKYNHTKILNLSRIDESAIYYRHIPILTCICENYYVLTEHWMIYLVPIYFDN